MKTFTLRQVSEPSFLYRACIDAPAVPIPLFSSRVPAGAFPSPALEYIEKELDLNDYLIAHPVATMFFIAKGESMRDANIFDGSVCVVDRSLVARHGHVVLASVDGDYTVKKLYIVEDEFELHPANPAFQPMRFNKHQEVKVVGVVCGTVAKFKV